MKETQDLTKMEFVIKLNDNIVVQRFFNVKGYNETAKNSMELYEYMKTVSAYIEGYLKDKSLDYMTENAELIMNDPSVMNTSKTDGPEWFYLYIKMGEHTIFHRGFDAKVYPPKARYTVDIRPEIKTILKSLTDIFSGENFSTTYMDYQLD
jgi:hypothetical protein